MARYEGVPFQRVNSAAETAANTVMSGQAPIVKPQRGGRMANPQQSGMENALGVLADKLHPTAP